MFKKFLRFMLKGKYYEYEINRIQDVCTLTGMLFIGTLARLGQLILITIILGVVGVIIASVGTMIVGALVKLPDYTLRLQEVGVSVVGMISVLVFINSLIMYGKGEIPFLPKWLPFKGKVKKEVKTNKSWTLIKDMYRPVKDKTCVKFSWDD